MALGDPWERVILSSKWVTPHRLRTTRVERRKRLQTDAKFLLAKVAQEDALFWGEWIRTIRFSSIFNIYCSWSVKSKLPSSALIINKVLTSGKTNQVIYGNINLRTHHVGVIKSIPKLVGLTDVENRKRQFNCVYINTDTHTHTTQNAEFVFYFTHTLFPVTSLWHFFVHSDELIFWLSCANKTCSWIIQKLET